MCCMYEVIVISVGQDEGAEVGAAQLTEARGVL